MQKQLFDKRSINKKFSEQIKDFDTDKFYQDLTENDKLILLEQLEFGKTINGKRIWNVGEIKPCPICNKTRITSCCACGCGNCYTCGNRWCCISTPTGSSFFEFQGIIKD